MVTQIRLKAARRITLIGFAVNLLLGLVKIFFGIIGHSQALFADGIHSLSDLLTDVLVLVATHFGSQRADREHPYGHARIETAATVLLAVLLLLTGMGIVYDGIRDVIQGVSEVPSSYVLLIAGLSVLANEILFHATWRTAKEIKSPLLEANAWHHRSDAASSIVVLIGVAGALLGYGYLDALAAVVVGLMIGKMAISLAWSGLRELVDTAVDEQMQQHIEQVISATPGVLAIHQLRTRSMGGAIFVDVHLLVKPQLTVSEGHYIGLQVHQALLQEIEAITDVTVHIDPEDDERVPPSLHLPSREKLLPQLMTYWQGLPGVDDIQLIQIHYLSGQIHLDVYFPLAMASQHQDVSSLTLLYQQALDHEVTIKTVSIYFGGNGETAP